MNLFKKKPIKTETILQMEATECGAASLAIVLAYHKVYIPLSKLRDMCGVSRDGSSASSIVNAATQFKLKPKAVNIDIDKIHEKVVFPAILFWNFNHFLVLEGYDDKKNIFYVNDPASGRREVQFKEFDESFTGIALNFEKDEGFKKIGSKPSNFGSYLAILKSSKPDLLFIAIATLLLVVPGLTIPVFTQIFIDDILIGKTYSLVSLLIIAMIAILVIQLVLILLQQISLTLLGIKLSVVGSTNFLTHIVKLPIMFFSQRSTGDIVNRVSLNEKIALTLSRNISTNVINLLTSVIYGAAMLSYDATLGSIVIAIMFVNVFVLRLLKEGQNNSNQVMFKEVAMLMGTSMNGLSIINTLKATGMENVFFKKWSGYQAKMLNAEQKLAVYSYILNLTPVFLNSLALVLVFYFGSFKIIDGIITVGTLIAFQSLMSSFTSPISNLVGFASELQVLKGDMDRTNDALKHKEDQLINIDDSGDKSYRLSGKIEMKDIIFAYGKYDKPVIDKLNISISTGTMLAIVGSSGSGKSTLIKLLSRLYYPTSGSIIVDDKPLNNIDRFLFSQSISVVSQDIILFPGSIHENLSFWNKDVDPADINRALKDTCLLDLINTLPGDINHQIEEGGRNFSGGQKQCLEIARALTSNPSILVLDEATSALDSILELNIINNIKRRGCTCIVVAHRLSAIRDAHRIIVLDKGGIIQSGTHNELIKEDNLYRTLISKQ